MEKDPNRELRDIANGSGFLFQLRVEHEIKETRADHGWHIFPREHPWADQEARESGYIDLILARNSHRIVIECKRPRDAKWLFVVTEEDKWNQNRARCQWTEFDTANSSKQAGWQDYSIIPSSPEAEFCMIRGGEEGKATLERWAGSLLTALESFAAEELQITKVPFKCIYLPFIVTTAQLAVYNFNSQDISLEKGIMQTGNFVPRPFVRFRKSLTTRLSSPNAQPGNIRHANKDKERTVFVVQASSLVEILEGLHINND